MLVISATASGACSVLLSTLTIAPPAVSTTESVAVSRSRNIRAVRS